MDIFSSLLLVAVILIATIGFVFLALKLLNKDGNALTKYDERQKMARGEAYKYAFFSVIIADGVLMFAGIFGDGFKSLGFNIFFIPIFIGVVVQVSVSIFKDAYVGLNTNMTKFMIFMFIVSAFNLGLGIRAIVAKEMIVDGELQTPFLNILCGLLFIILAVELLIKMLIDKKED